MEKLFKGKLPTLSPRLETIINMINPGERLIDVGTDHSFVPIIIIIKGIRKIAIATDIREGPLKIANRNIVKFDLQDKIRLLRTDGLKGISIHQDDCIVIAGMGGYEIISILQEKLPECKNIILQPQKSIMELRQFLSEKGYEIEDEKVIKEYNRFYIAIKVKYTGIKYCLDLTQQIAGPVILANKGELFKEYMIYLINQMEKMKNGNSNLGFVKLNLETELNKYENQ